MDDQFGDLTDGLNEDEYPPDLLHGDVEGGHELQGIPGIPGIRPAQLVRQVRISQESRELKKFEERGEYIPSGLKNVSDSSGMDSPGILTFL